MAVNTGTSKPLKVTTGLVETLALKRDDFTIICPLPSKQNKKVIITTVVGNKNNNLAATPTYLFSHCQK